MERGKDGNGEIVVVVVCLILIALISRDDFWNWLTNI